MPRQAKPEEARLLRWPSQQKDSAKSSHAKPTIASETSFPQSSQSTFFWSSLY